MSATQSNTKSGNRSYNSGIALIGLEGYLAKVVDGGSIPELLLPESVSDICLFVVEDGGALDTPSEVKPLVPGSEIRIKAKGTGSAGGVAVLAAISGSDAGMVRAVPATEGAYFSPGTFAEDFVDGQLVKINPLPRLVHVGTAFTAAAPAATAPTNSSPYGFSQTQAQAILTNVIELRAWAVAQGFKATS